MKDNLIEFRRYLHRIPELDFDLPKTTAYIIEYLDMLPCDITPIGKASFVAFFDAGKDSTLAFRTDMDALAIEEKLKHEYSSVHEGQMHACGHDGHMSIMLGFASEVSKLMGDGPGMLNKNVLLVFQAAEETTGGAKEICDSGVFQTRNVEKIFGLHIWPGFPKHTVICRNDHFMAGTKVLSIIVGGKSAHVAKPEDGIDALDIGTMMVQDIYKMEREEIPKDVKRLLKFGEFNSGTGVNIISERTEIRGTTRYYDKKILDKMMNRMNEIFAEYENKYGCTIEFSATEGYPPVTNPPSLVNELITAVSNIDHDEISFFPLEDPFMTSEDFSYYQQEVPGLFFFVGTGLDVTLHNGYYDIDEDILPTGVEIFKALLLNN